MSDNETLLSGMQEKLAGKKGKMLWRSLEELAETEEFHKWVDDEFPNRADLLGLDRRQFLTLGGAALAMAGLTGCRILPQTKAVPFVRSPEDMVAGQQLSYATTLLRNGYGFGVLAEQYEGRPIKIEGNPKHPASLGATDVFEQAEILNMYDPDRSQNVTKDGEIAGWNEFVDMLHVGRRTWAGGLRILTGSVTSPLLTAQINALIANVPGTVWHAYEPINRDSVYAGTQTAFGTAVNPVYDLSKANVVVSLDADFFKTLPGNIRYARDFSNGRRVREDNSKMNRLYVVESSTTITGAAADHRWPVKPSQIESFARALFEAFTDGSPATKQPVEWLSHLVDDLKANTGLAVVIAGDEASPAVHAYAAAINSALGAIGQTVTYTAPVETSPLQHGTSLTELVTAMNAGQVSTLVILGGNPVYDAPADLKFADALKKVKTSIQHALYQDETTELVNWHIPATHALETWGDARAFDGTTSLIQPLIAPLYDGNKSVHELLAELQDQPLSGYDILQDFYKGKAGPSVNWERWWQQTLIDGTLPNSKAPAVAVTLNAAAVAGLTPPTETTGIELNFRADPTLWDGRYANNSWLQELPKPITTVTWDNVAIVSPATAKKISVTPTDGKSDAEDAAKISGKAVIEIKTDTGKSVKLPVWILPGHPNDTITVTLGFGRRKCGRIGEDIGQDVYPLRTSQTMNYSPKVTTSRVKLQGTGDTINMIGDATIGNSVDVFGDYRVAATQAQHLMRGIDIKETQDRDIVRHATLEEFIAKKGEIGPEPEGHHGPEEHEVSKAELPTDPGEEIVADHGIPALGLSGRDTWTYKDRDPAEKTITNPEGIVSLYPEFSKKDYNAWSMSIDLTTCIGCNACTIACQAENNIPTVGKEQVGRGRAMHWIRIDHYFSTIAADAIGLDKPETVEAYFMPVPCMHCEKAPCEPVCPVAATIHSHEGLNQMVYNRCVGTRYCSNNCPYKVRRFNFLKWTAGWGGKGTLNFFDLPVLKLASNPEVTVRGRGVMEKCSYCVQRINKARINAKKEEREIEDGEIITACQQACPTNAIIFGDLNNPNSQVSKLKRQPHDYGLLAELNTRPRTTYLAKVKNPNTAITPYAEVKGVITRN